MTTPHPRLPHFSALDLRVRHTPDGWSVEDARGQPVYETVSSMAEAQLIGRTFVPACGRVWVCRPDGWVLLDDD